MSYRKITIENKTYISPLQMYGPVINPINVSDNMVIDLVRKGYIVNEKLKNGKIIRLNLFNMRNPYATVTAPQVTPTKRIVPETVIPKAVAPTVAPTPKVEVQTESVSVFDNGERDYGETVSAINVVPIEEEVVPTKVNVIPVTPEEKGISVIGVTEIAEEAQTADEIIVQETSNEEDTIEEESSESDETESVADSNNQIRRNKKKKRR